MVDGYVLLGARHLRSMRKKISPRHRTAMGLTVALCLLLFYVDNLDRVNEANYPANVLCWDTLTARPVRDDPTTWLSSNPTAGSVTIRDVPAATCAPFLHVVINPTFNHPSVPEPRRAELKAALLANLEYAFVKHVHVLWDGHADSVFINMLPLPALAKLVSTTHHGRMTFLSAAAYINSGGHIPRGEAVLLTNADVAIRGGFDCGSLEPSTLPYNTVLVPQRQEAECHYDGVRKSTTCDCRKETHRDDAHTRLLNCFDSYVLRAPLPKALVSEARLGAIYAGGQMGCENSFVAELRSVGVSVYSPPCGQFKLVHEHCSNSRTYSIRGGDGSGQSRIDYKRYDERLVNPTEPACYATLCKWTCERPYVPFVDADPLAAICQNASRDRRRCDRLWADTLQSHFPGGLAEVCGIGASRQSMPSCSVSESLRRFVANPRGRPTQGLETLPTDEPWLSRLRHAFGRGVQLHSRHAHEEASAGRLMGGG